MRRLVAPLLALVVIVVAAQPAGAHDPVFLTDEQQTPETGPLLPDGTISFALYGRVDGADDSRGFQVRFAAGDELLVELLVPDQAPEIDLDVGDLPVVTVTAPDGTVTELVADRREPFTEPFTDTSYVSLARVDGVATAGVHDVLITGMVPARFTVVVGTTETFFTPVERVANRVESFVDIAGPLGEWYDTPPVVATPEEPETTTTSTTTTTTTTTVAPDQAPDDSTETASGADETETASGADEAGADETGADETGADETGADETGADDDGGASVGLFVALAVIALGVGGAAFALLRRPGAPAGG